MSPAPGPRPGGRSARIQQAVHASTRKLLDERDRADITVPMIAADAGVTPSTIYRRWGDITELFADVALERLHPDAPRVKPAVCEATSLPGRRTTSRRCPHRWGGRHCATS
ncbi:TetR/AcrR family transcriptional regulator [Rhodococcus opacus]|uniref:TetR/AcrR family transcriptional regulator n=1 Tax=Rhodococcus opacus TaxID=37919 RepID=UPI001F5A5437|nr:TetR/AcrR family transcriptional regulator [Rhodococcus opacus]UNN03809.1 TetR/AcrR family transcriptional regulator [Rhodococcus opacus]